MYGQEGHLWQGGDAHRIPGNGSVHSQELDSMILVGVFQLSLFSDSVVAHGFYGLASLV